MREVSNISASERIGSFDKKITIQEKSITVSSDGQRLESWVTFANTWANITYEIIGSNEKYERMKLTATQKAIAKIRFRNGVTTRHRILYNNLIYNILSVQEIGRKSFLELKLEQKSE